jgi:hypothetical protein
MTRTPQLNDTRTSSGVLDSLDPILGHRHIGTESCFDDDPLRGIGNFLTDRAKAAIAASVQLRSTPSPRQTSKTVRPSKTVSTACSTSFATRRHRESFDAND